MGWVTKTGKIGSTKLTGRTRVHETVTEELLGLDKAVFISKLQLSYHLPAAQAAT